MMGSRPKMYVPSDFVVEEGANVEIRTCRIIKYKLGIVEYVNSYKTLFEGDVLIRGWDIYTEDEPVVFIDKLNSYITGEERLV